MILVLAIFKNTPHKTSQTTGIVVFDNFIWPLRPSKIYEIIRKLTLAKVNNKSITKVNNISKLSTGFTCDF